MKKLNVGIDVAKDKFDVAFTINGQDIFGQEVFSNDKQGFKQFLKKAENLLKKEGREQLHFCMEATGIYHCELCEFLQNSAQVVVSVVNPLATKSFAQSLLLRTKNDKVDSSMIARYAYTYNPEATPKQEVTMKSIRRFVRYRERLIRDKARLSTRKKSAQEKEIKKLIEQNIVFMAKQIDTVEKKIKELIQSDEFYAKQEELLKSVDGIGDGAAWKILSELKFEDIQQISPKAQVAHAGLSPREYSSGSSVKGKARISRIGNSDLRKALFFPALTCIRQNNYFTPFYLRLLERGKPKKVAIVAVMRKILLTAMGVLKNQQPFCPNWATKVQAKYKEILMQNI